MSELSSKKSSQVGVIIPTYNRASWLRGAIDSVLDQTCTDFELIVVDDGSTDNTKEIVAEYGDRIRYYYQPNKGPSAARNKGIRQTKANWICFLDSDDRWTKNKLYSQIELINKNSDAKICYTNEIWIRQGKRVNQKKVHQKYSGWIYQECLPLCIVSPSSVMIHRDVFDKVGEFDENLLVCEDYDLWLRISCHYPIFFIDKPLIIKNGGHKDQLSRQYWGMDRFRVKALEKMLQKNILSEQDRQATIDTLKKKCTILANGCFKRGRLEEGNTFLNVIKKFSR